MKIFNTLTGRKEDFVPQGDTVLMYVCGITPYSDSHIGHAMSYIIFDAIRRYLIFRGYKVKYVQNFTDIDDKVIDRAAKLGTTPKQLAEEVIEQFFDDMDALNIERADVYPRVTQEIPQIIEVIQGLVDKGHAYPTADGVYFRVRSDPHYGALSHQSLDSLLAGARVEPGGDKESPMDFALWKAAKPGEPYWESPWGKGRPGWHIECSAMALKYLGPTLDIHGGGQDLIFPHHENEIAQTECFTGVTPFVRYWLHNGLLRLGEEKMSKSLGNLVTVCEALEHFTADAVRLFILGSHYRSPLTYSEESLGAAERGADRLRQAAHRESQGDESLVVDVESFRQEFTEAMDDDFNTAQALALLFDLAREINRVCDEGFGARKAQQALLDLAAVLGLTLEEKDIHLAAAPFIELLISVRQELRQHKQWQLADQIRSGLSKLDIALEDTPQGTAWKHKRAGEDQ